MGQTIQWVILPPSEGRIMSPVAIYLTSR